MTLSQVSSHEGKALQRKGCKEAIAAITMKKDSAMMRVYTGYDRSTKEENHIQRTKLLMPTTN
jgi:hypothetical protein